MAETRRGRSVSQAHLLDLVVEQFRAHRASPPDGPVEVVDVGGGTGGLAIALAQHGFRVTVVDPSLDALASLQRRTAEAGLSETVRGLQGDTTDLLDVVGPDSVDGVVCHRVLEVLDDPAAALSSITAVLRRGGLVSLAVAQRHATVMSRALAGHLREARQVYADPRRFDYDRVLALVGGAGLEVLATSGVGAVSDLVAESLVESDSTAPAELAALELELSEDPAFRRLASLVHVLCRRPAAD